MKVAFIRLGVYSFDWAFARVCWECDDDNKTRQAKDCAGCRMQFPPFSLLTAILRSRRRRSIRKLSTSLFCFVCRVGWLVGLPVVVLYLAVGLLPSCVQYFYSSETRQTAMLYFASHNTTQHSTVQHSTS